MSRQSVLLDAFLMDVKKMPHYQNLSVVHFPYPGTRPQKGVVRGKFLKMNESAKTVSLVDRSSQLWSQWCFLLPLKVIKTLTLDLLHRL